MDQAPIYASSERIDQILGTYRDQLGGDFDGYRGHTLRVLTHAMAFIGDDQTHLPLMETVAAYHDIGIWTKDDLAYLEPSVDLVLKDNAAMGWGFDPELLKAMIHWHHKITPYRGANADLVNAFRKADWIEASEGKIRKGVSKGRLKEVHDAIPDHGFANILKEAMTRLGGSFAKGQMRVLRTVFKF